MRISRRDGNADPISPLSLLAKLLPVIQSVMLVLFGYFARDIMSSTDNDIICASATSPSVVLPLDKKDDEQLAARDSLPSHFKESHSMDWTIPEDIRRERHKECEGRKTSSTGGFCLTKQTVIGGNNWVDTPLGEHLRDHLFRDKTVVDLGAGLGHYGKIFTEQNSPVKSWVGFDGAMNVQNATDGLVRFMDLTQPHAADERPCVKGDWVLSLEVAEHIPPQFTDSFIRNIRCSCTVGAVVSWARPSQTGGLGHVNTKHREDAINAMKRWGFQVDEEATKAVQEASSMKHFKANTIVYRV